MRGEARSAESSMIVSHLEEYHLHRTSHRWALEFAIAPPTSPQTSPKRS